MGPAYAATPGPIDGDGGMLGDTCVAVKMEKEFAMAGDEIKCGDGKMAF